MNNFNSSKISTLKIIDRTFKLLYFNSKNKHSYLPITQNDFKEILVIGFFMIGDTIMSIPVLKTLKQTYKEAKITLVCTHVAKVILQDQNIVDYFIVVDCPWISKSYSLKNLFDFFVTKIGTINKVKYDLSLDLRGDWRNIFFMNFINSNRKISFNYTGGEYMLTDVVKENTTYKHYIDEWLYFVEQIGCKVQAVNKFPVLELTSAEQKKLKAYKADHNIGNELTIGIHPGASMAHRKWDEIKYFELMECIFKDYSNCQFVVFEGPNEASTINILENLLKNAQIKYHIINEKLKDYITLINCSDILISNDSGAGHVSSAFGIPTVVIFGKADPEIVKPYNKNTIKIISHLDELGKNHDPIFYMKSITVKEVYEKVKEIFESTPTIKF